MPLKGTGQERLLTQLRLGSFGVSVDVTDAG